MVSIRASRSAVIWLVLALTISACRGASSTDSSTTTTGVPQTTTGTAPADATTTTTTTGVPQTTTGTAPADATTTTTTTTTTTSTTTTTTSTTTTTTTLLLLAWDGPECTVAQATLWFGSDIGNVDAFNDNLAAGVELRDALDDIGAPSDELFGQRGSVGISNWLFEQLQSTRVYADGEVDAQVLLCVAAPDSASIGFSGSGLAASLTEVYAGRYGLPGKVLTDEQLAALQERLEPDGDGLYFVHSGQGDSEDFEVPGVFRVTYTGTSRTCALDISDPGTGEELEFVSSLDGGGFQRVFLDTSVDDISLVYIAGVIGCRNGRVEIGPDGELPEVSEASLDPDGDGFYYVHVARPGAGRRPPDRRGARNPVPGGGMTPEPPPAPQPGRQAARPHPTSGERV